MIFLKNACRKYAELTQKGGTGEEMQKARYEIIANAMFLSGYELADEGGQEGRLIWRSIEKGGTDSKS